MANKNELHNINKNHNDDDDAGRNGAESLVGETEGLNVDGDGDGDGSGGGGGVGVGFGFRVDGVAGAAGDDVQQILTHHRFNDDDDESRWLKLEQNDYEIDQICPIGLPSTATTTATARATARATATSLSENISNSSANENIEENFNRLHQIADKIKHTIREHLNSESSTCSDGLIDADNSNNINTTNYTITNLNNNNNNNNNNLNSNINSQSSNILPDPFVNHYADQTLDEFKEELRLKREARQNVVQQMRNEIANLRQQLQTERELNKHLRLCNSNSIDNFSLNTINNCNNNNNNNNNNSKNDNNSNQENEMLNIAGNQLNINENLNTNSNNNNNNNNNINVVNEVNDINDNGNGNVNGAEMMTQRNRQAIIELANAQLSLQMANSENISLRTELGAVQKQCATLKEVVACCKQMMAIKEEQCNEQTPLTVILGEDLRKKMANALEKLQLTEMNNRLKLY